MRSCSLEGKPRRSERDVSGGSAAGCSLQQSSGGGGRMLLLARSVILEVFPSAPGTDPVSGSIPRPAGAMATGTTVGKSTGSAGGWKGRGGGRGVFLRGSRWEPRKPNRPRSPGKGCRDGWAGLVMPSKETGPSGGRQGGGGGRALAQDEPERLDLLPNPPTRIPLFLLNAAKRVYFPPSSL